MKIPSFLSVGTAIAAAVVSLWYPRGAAAELAPPPGPALECLRQCAALSSSCARACNASLIDCMRGPKVELRMCRAGCRDQFELETPEFESCVAGCREDILEPARQECGPLRGECASQCQPLPCLRLCGPNGGGVGEWDECRGACAHDLRECALEGRAALRECLAPCRELTDDAARQECASPCLEAAKEGALACKAAFDSCASGCDQPTTTTTLSEP